MKKPVQITRKPVVANDFPLQRPDGMDPELYRNLRRMHNQATKTYLRGEFDKDRTKVAGGITMSQDELRQQRLKEFLAKNTVKPLCVPTAEEEDYVPRSRLYKLYRSFLQWLRDRLSSR